MKRSDLPVVRSDNGWLLPKRASDQDLTRLR